MRQICPNCQQSLEVEAGEAGKTAICPGCGHSFAVPAGYKGAVFASPSVPPPPPTVPIANAAAEPHVSAATVGAVAAAAAEGSTPKPLHRTGETQHQHVHSITLSRRVCAGLPPVCLLLAFVLSFFTWVGFFPAGFTAYSQNAWQALFADFSVDPVSEKVFGREKSIETGLTSAWWLLPYVIFLTLGMLVAWIEPIAGALKRKLPASLGRLLHYRPAILSACAGLTLAFLIAQSAAGFSLQNAYREKVPDELVEEKNNARTPEEIQIVQMKIAVVQGTFPVRTTFWLRLAIVFHVLAVLGIIGETILIHRGRSRRRG